MPRRFDHLRPSLAALLLALSAGVASAQGAGSWVDPPPEATAPREGGAAPQTEPASPAPAPAPPPTPAPRSAPPPAAEALPPERAPPREPAPPVERAEPRRPAPEPVERAEPRRPAPPPVERVEPREPPAPPPAREVERPRTEPRETVERPAPRPTRSRAAIARDFTLDYLDSWSAPNAFALEETSDFYAPRVEFHGREMSARALFQLKQRFVQRWPVRDYRIRRDAMAVECDRAEETCAVQAPFDFLAENPARGRRSQGSGTLQLVISFEEGRPRILGETSRVNRRGRGARETAAEDDDE